MRPTVDHGSSQYLSDHFTKSHRAKFWGIQPSLRLRPPGPGRPQTNLRQSRERFNRTLKERGCIHGRIYRNIDGAAGRPVRDFVEALAMPSRESICRKNAAYPRRIRPAASIVRRRPTPADRRLWVPSA